MPDLRFGIPSNFRLVLVAFLAVVVAACDDNPMTPTQELVLACPAGQSTTSSTGNAITVQFPAPVATGGTAPVTTTCTPASGSAFPVGTTSVNCTGRDARGATAMCSFFVSVQAPPRIQVTRFVAFGDSITAGTLSFSPMFTLIPSPPTSYPFKLEGMLNARYTAQTSTVLDEGVAGETVEGGLARLPQVLNTHMPEVVLLMEGINNLNQGGASAIPGIINALRSMIRTTASRGAVPLLGTFLPQRPGGQRAFSWQYVEPANAEIRALAMAERVALVDLYAGMGGTPDPWIGADGLHPNETGYQKMAEISFGVIRQTFEAPVAATRWSP